MSPNVCMFDKKYAPILFGMKIVSFQISINECFTNVSLDAVTQRKEWEKIL